jgi:hypothetical protein
MEVRDTDMRLKYIHVLHMFDVDWGLISGDSVHLNLSIIETANQYAIIFRNWRDLSILNSVWQLESAAWDQLAPRVKDEADKFPLVRARIEILTKGRLSNFDYLVIRDPAPLEAERANNSTPSLINPQHSYPIVIVHYSEWLLLLAIGDSDI